jgi:hypothetical protein
MKHYCLTCGKAIYHEPCKLIHGTLLTCSHKCSLSKLKKPKTVFYEYFLKFCKESAEKIRNEYDYNFNKMLEYAGTNKAWVYVEKERRLDNLRSFIDRYSLMLRRKLKKEEICY